MLEQAAVLTFSDKVDDVIPPTVKGALQILTSATKEPSIKSVVLTSSSTAALMPHPGEVLHITQDSWNKEATEAVNAGNADGFTVYGASKAQAEEAFWQAIDQAKPPFQVAAVRDIAFLV